MRLLVDECVSGQIVDALRKTGHDVSWATEVCASANDEAMMALAFAERRLVVTFDRGIGNRAVRDRRPAIGVLQLTASEAEDDLAAFASRLAERLAAASESVFLGRLTIFEGDRTRQRDLPSDADPV